MDKTLDMAREAGFTDGELAFMGDNFRRFEALVRADEREVCAKVCEDDVLSSHYGERSKYRELLANAIRARGNT
jgi:hypothetical protein